MSEQLGRWHFWLFVVGFNLTFLPMHWVGCSAAVLVFFLNIVASLRRGERAGEDPWDAWTLEWATGLPPPPYNFETVPSVASRRPLWDLKHPDDPDGPHE